jgi:hypothetical protein
LLLLVGETDALVANLLAQLFFHLTGGDALAANLLERLCCHPKSGGVLVADPLARLYFHLKVEDVLDLPERLWCHLRAAGALDFPNGYDTIWKPRALPIPFFLRKAVDLALDSTQASG